MLQLKNMTFKFIIIQIPDIFKNNYEMNCT
jgi:hypothetical protein